MNIQEMVYLLIYCSQCCASKKFNITLEEISNYSELTISKVKDLLNKYRLNDKILLLLNYELRKTVNETKSYNENILKLK